MKKRISLLLAILMLVCVLSACDSAAALARGETKDNVYTNSSLGITFTKPENWRFYTEDEIAEMMNITAEMFKDEDLINSSDVTSLIEFMALDSKTGSNVNLTIENLRFGNKNITVEEYAELAKTQLKEQLAGATYTFGEEKTVSLGTLSCLRIHAKCSYSGVNMDQYLYLSKVGSHMVVITATSNDGSTPETFEKMFS